MLYSRFPSNKRGTIPEFYGLEFRVTKTTGNVAAGRVGGAAGRETMAPRGVPRVSIGKVEVAI